MKKMLFGIVLILFGISCLLVAWMGNLRVIDLLGLGLALMGFVCAIIGLFDKD